jgi:hypothetical protein
MCDTNVQNLGGSAAHAAAKISYIQNGRNEGRKEGR